MTPIQTWKKNKWRLDMRKYTREFSQRFHEKKKVSIFPGCIYGIKYLQDSRIPTDKHHVTPLFLSFGRFRDDKGTIHARGINLFYLKNEQKLEIMEEAFKISKLVPDSRVSPMLKIHEKWMKIAPYAFKNFEESRIMGISEVEVNEWGMIPLLKDYLIGNFNPVALNEDFKSENTSFSKFKRRKKSSQQLSNLNEEQDEQDDQQEEFILEETVPLDLGDDLRNLSQEDI